VIDGGLHLPWPPEVTSKLATFRQGSLIQSPPFAYHASTLHPIWAASRLAATGSDSLMLVELDPADCPPYGIITTQCCDIDEAGPRPRKPWVQVAPVYEVPPDDPSLGNVRRWRVHHLAPVTALGPCWVADLRIEFPIEKSWIAQQVPIHGFNSPDEFAEFSKHCGNYRTRPALANSVYDEVLTPLEKALQELRKNNNAAYSAFVSSVEHIYVDIADDPLEPRVVQVIFVSPEKLARELVDQLDGWWTETFGGRALPFQVLSNRYLTFDEVHFREQRKWVEQDVARLSGSS
jgi:hypothetical protein